MMQAVRDRKGNLEAARKRGTIYEHGGAWHCTTHGDMLTAAFPDRLACPQPNCKTEVVVA